MFSKYYKGMLWESLPKGEEKEKLIAATDDELEKLYDKSKVEAMKVYRDYKNFKKTIKNGEVVVRNNYSSCSNSKDISLLSDSVEKTLIGLLTKSYSLAKSEINSAKGIVSSAAGSAVRVFRAAGGMLSSIFGGDPIAKTKFEADVQKPIKELCEFSKKKYYCGFSRSKDFNSDEKDIEEIFNKFKQTQASLEEYVNYTFEQFPRNETFENMPGVQVFLRILLGLAGIERSGKGISSDGVENGKARANYVFEFSGCKSYSFGGGLLALLVYKAVVAIKKIQMQNHTLLAPFTSADEEELDRKSSEVRNKLKPFKDKYGK